MCKHFLSLLLFLCLLSAVSVGLAADNGADPLSYDELSGLCDIVLNYARSQEAVLVPENEADITEDGYAFQYSFGTLYLNHPQMDEDAQLLSIVLSGEVTACHDTYVGQPISDLFAAYYSENTSLVGDHEHAVLYLFDNLPASASWAWVARDGQRITSVQYSVHTLQEDGTYSDSGLLYNIESDTVNLIRMYGISSRISLADVQATLRLVAQSASASGYAAVPVSYDGLTLTPFSESDLVFSGIDFLHTSPEDAVRLFGTPIEDTSMDDSDGTRVRMMDFGSCEIFFRYDSSDGTAHIESVTIGTDGLEGPRAVRVGDDFSSVLTRFRFGEGEYEDGREVLYGDPAGGSYGLSEYGDDASATLRYYTTAQDGTRVLMMGIFEQMQLRELLILRDN